MIRIPEIKLPVGHSAEELKGEVLRSLAIGGDALVSYRIVRQSIDARKKSRILFVYAIDVELVDEESILAVQPSLKVARLSETKYQYGIGDSRGATRPVIIGAGPAGLFAALVLATAGRAPIILERGKAVEERAKDVERFLMDRILDPDSNVQFGEGGAGTFSDGKLTTLIKDPRCQKVLEEFVASGAPEEILFKNKPHIGTDLLRRVIVNLRNRITALGGEFRFSSHVTGLVVEDGRVAGVVVKGCGTLHTDRVVLAIGNSARDTFTVLHDAGVEMRQKPFSIGVRIEHPQRLIDRAQYGACAGDPRLGSAEYKLAHHCGGKRSVYTFCMCPGGSVIAAATEAGCVVTNGMSEHARDLENANSALLVGVGPEDYGSPHPLAGIEFQRRWERLAFQAGGGNYSAPVQRLGDFLKGLQPRGEVQFREVRPTYRPGVVAADLNNCLPDYVCRAMREAVPEFDRKLRGFAMPDAVLTGVETRSSCPVRIVRNEVYESNIGGLYPAGEGAGYAGGIVSSAVDGIRIAEAVTGSSLTTGRALS